MINIFIGTYEVPAGGQWYDLSDPEQNINAQAKWTELCNGSSEPLISDVESDFDLIKENNIEYYIEMEEFLENIYKDDLPKVYGLLLHDSRYYNTVDLLTSAMDDTTLWYGTFSDMVDQIVDDRFSYYASGQEAKNLISFVRSYFDYEKFERDLSIEMNYEAFEYQGEDYVLEIY